MHRMPEHVPDECPVSCIAEKDGKYEINADECIDCGTCASVALLKLPLLSKQIEKRQKESNRGCKTTVLFLQMYKC